MTFICYDESISFNEYQLDIIARCNALIEKYEANNISLTLRSLYYRFISLYPSVLDVKNEGRNLPKHYKKLGKILGDARLAGEVSWEALEDLTRNLEKRSHWNKPAEILESAYRSYGENLWANQPVVVEHWIEKDAAINTVKGVCEENDVPYFSCRGNCSLSEMWVAGQRIRNRYRKTGKPTIILYGGDLDPKGWDMDRDIERRLSLFAEMDVEFRRIYLTPEQVEIYNPEPLPTKDSDTTSKAFREEFGEDAPAYELDSMDPLDIRDEIQAQVEAIRDPKLWDEAVARQAESKAVLRGMIDLANGEEPSDEDEED